MFYLVGALVVVAIVASTQRSFTAFSKRFDRNRPLCAEEEVYIEISQFTPNGLTIYHKVIVVSMVGETVICKDRRGQSLRAHRRQLLAKVMPPRYKHDCRKCKYLGPYEEYDLYHCYNCALAKGTVIARHGNEGWEYASTPILLIDQLPSIYVADSASSTTRALLKARQLVTNH